MERTRIEEPLCSREAKKGVLKNLWLRATESEREDAINWAAAQLKAQHPHASEKECADAIREVITASVGVGHEVS